MLFIQEVAHMHVRYEIASLPYTCASMAEFFAPGMEMFGESIADLYPDLKGKALSQMDEAGRTCAIQTVIAPQYAEAGQALSEKETAYQAEWDALEMSITQAFEAVFGMPLQNRFDDVRARISLNPVCPRYLAERTFDTYWAYSARGSIANALHELTHFIWFDRWQAIFGDDPSTYEQLHLTWIFSELAIDAVLTDPRLKRFVSHPPAAERPAYPSFYELTAEGQPLIDTFRKLYSENTIEGFMLEGLKLCKQYEEILRTAV